MKLTLLQIEAITRLLIDSGIKYQEIYDELLDHYIVAVEEQMQKELHFDAALALTHRSFGQGRGLQQLQTRRYKSLKDTFEWRDSIQIIKTQLKLPYVWICMGLFIYFDSLFIHSSNTYGLILVNALLFVPPGWIYWQLQQLGIQFQQVHRLGHLELKAVKQYIDETIGVMLATSLSVHLSTRSPDPIQTGMIYVMTALLVLWSWTYSIQFFTYYQRLKKRLT